jgi:hypothetical protein
VGAAVRGEIVLTFLKEIIMESLVFLGRNCNGGVSALLKQRLLAAQTDIVQKWQAAGSPGTFEEYVGLRQNHGAAHQGGHHTTGDALDVNYQTNPYIATRSWRTNGGVEYGGEALPSPQPSAPPPPTEAEMRMARVRATAACDRAAAFSTGETAVANLSTRRRASGVTESTSEVFNRFLAASINLQFYLGLAFRPRTYDGNGLAVSVTRAPAVDSHDATLQDLLTAIPTSERWDESTARANIDGWISGSGSIWPQAHPHWTTDTDFWLRQILRDYEIVRIPMVIGTPSLTPAVTRNPSDGFVDLPEDVVVSMCDAGLRWGASDFGIGASGDVQHFDDFPAIVADVPTMDDVLVDLNTDAGVQQALASLGFDPGTIDNQAGSRTKKAVGAFVGSPGVEIDVDDSIRDGLRAVLRDRAIPFDDV